VDREISFWLAVMLIAVAGVALFKLLAATAAGEKIPGVRPLAALI
jgi:hypothetical protein